jgi:hypothetical protein
MTQEEWKAMKTNALKDMRLSNEVNMDEVHRRIKELQELAETLQNWLNRLLPN